MEKEYPGKNRREFLKETAAAGAFVALPFGIESGASKRGGKTSSPGIKKTRQEERPFSGRYSGEYLNRIAFPIGGIGAGMIALEGTGAISHVSVYNKPDMYNQPNMFAAISLKGIDNGARVLEGPVPDWKIFGSPGTGNGASGSNYGLPRFANAAFDARFPFGRLSLQDKEIPVEVEITGWSPFIPLDEDNSGLPAGALEYRFVNKSGSTLEAVFSYHSVNFMRQPGNKHSVQPAGNGFILTNKRQNNSQGLDGEFAIFTNEQGTLVDHCWFRGTWYDPLSITWKHIEEGIPRSTPPVESEAPGASLYVPFSLPAGGEKTIRLMFAWYVPNSTLRSGETAFERLYLNKEKEAEPENVCGSTHYSTWYGRRFKNIDDVIDYWRAGYEDLKNRSQAFTESFYNVTLPDEVIEAVAANLTILKSPTVLRQCDGKLWGWEGCRDDVGCCFGTCTHVWNYAQSIPHLFPALERTMRETEFNYALNDEGHHTFRVGIPIRETGHDFYSAADGQLGEIMKAYRDWRIYGDDAWLKTIYPKVKMSMDFCIREWDPRETGLLEEPHHNTYDIEFWGPNGMCSSFYLGALKAVILMGGYLGQDTKRYRDLLKSGAKAMVARLYNGEYFIQKIMVEGLSSPPPIEAAARSLRSTYSDEAKALMVKEGPKYQYGEGCLSDGVLGFWIARVCGIDDPIIEEEKTNSHLLSVHKYNLKHDLSTHSNPQRPTYAMKNESGLLLCTWPKGGKLSLPFVYSNEVWTGIEYQVASHLMFEGYVEEGLEIVRACRKRYDGKVRNPFNEYECGHWYARAMASYGLIQGLTGIRYDAVAKTLFIDSKIGDDFTSFLSCQSGYGNVGLEEGVPFVKMVSGTMDIRKCIVSGKEFPAQKIIVKNG